MKEGGKQLYVMVNKFVMKLGNPVQLLLSIHTMLYLKYTKERIYHSKQYIEPSLTYRGLKLDIL